MATAKEIKSQIGSIQNTKKITHAMEMIAASKLKSARDRMTAGKPYAQAARQIIGHLAVARPEYQHPYLQERDVRRVGFIIISTDRGLCGGLNLNLFKYLVNDMQQWQSKRIPIDIAVIGYKGEAFFKSMPVNIKAYAHHLGYSPEVQDLIGAVKVMLDAYNAGAIDRLYLGHNEFTNTIKQTPRCQQLLPLVAKPDEATPPHWDYIYEPDAKSLLTLLLTRYIESQVYHGVVENIACEQAARMMAMKNATDNADELIRDLQLAYNKARQAAITREIAEIVSGAVAVET